MRTENEIRPVNLKTKILEGERAILPYIEVKSGGNSYVAYLYYRDESNEFIRLGHITYRLMQDYLIDSYLDLEFINNDIGYGIKNIGTALHEFAFRESVRLGGYGKVHISVNQRSHYFHFRCGFTPSYTDDPICSAPDEHREMLDRLFEAYLCEKSQKAKEEIDNYLITSKLDIKIFKDCARKVLEKSAEEDITFDEIIEHGLYWQDDKREQLEKKFAEIKKRNPNGRTVLPQKDHIKSMHLTTAEINKKLKLFGLTINEPNIYKRRHIGLTLFEIKHQSRSEVESKIEKHGIECFP